MRRLCGVALNTVGNYFYSSFFLQVRAINSVATYAEYIRLQAYIA